MRTISTVLALVLFGPVSGAEPVPTFAAFAEPATALDFTAFSAPPAVIVQAAPVVVPEVTRTSRPFSITDGTRLMPAQSVHSSGWSSPATVPAAVITTPVTARPIRRLSQSGGIVGNCTYG